MDRLAVLSMDTSLSHLLWCTKNLVIKLGFGTIFQLKTFFDDDGPLLKNPFWKQNRNSHTVISSAVLAGRLGFQRSRQLIAPWHWPYAKLPRLDQTKNTIRMTQHHLYGKNGENTSKTLETKNVFKKCTLCPND